MSIKQCLTKETSFIYLHDFYKNYWKHNNLFVTLQVVISITLFSEAQSVGLWLWWLYLLLRLSDPSKKRCPMRNNTLHRMNMQHIFIAITPMSTLLGVVEPVRILSFGPIDVFKKCSRSRQMNKNVNINIQWVHFC